MQAVERKKRRRQKEMGVEVKLNVPMIVGEGCNNRLKANKVLVERRYRFN